jgi:hypothetical protein
MPRRNARIAWIQGVYFTVFGVWPILHIRSFEAVSGKKTDYLVTGRESDHWLVNTVGVLIAVIGVTLIVAAWRRAVFSEIALLGFLSAMALAAVDVIYVARRTILPIYLADAAIELLIGGAWVFLAIANKRGNTRNSQ